METKSVSKIYTLNKTTYINLRWIAILGQFLTVNVVKFVFNFEFDILIVNVVIALGVISNIVLIYFYEKNIHNKQVLDNKVEKMSNFIFEGSWSENLNMIEQTFYEN